VGYGYKFLLVYFYVNKNRIPTKPSGYVYRYIFKHQAGMGIGMNFENGYGHMGERIGKPAPHYPIAIPNRGDLWAP